MIFSFHTFDTPSFSDRHTDFREIKSKSSQVKFLPQILVLKSTKDSV